MPGTKELPEVTALDRHTTRGVGHDPKEGEQTRKFVLTAVFRVPVMPRRAPGLTVLPRCGLS